jgi:hypothetical protein
MYESNIRQVYQKINIDDLDKYQQIDFYSNLTQILKSFVKQMLK